MLSVSGMISADSLNKYVMFTIYSGNVDKLYYAWLHVSVDSTGDKVILHDWAYNSTPNTPICAGEGLGCPSVLNIQIEGADTVAKIGNTLQLKTGSLIDTSVSWSVSNTAVATINSSGLLTGVSAGDVFIYAEKGDTTCSTIYDTLALEVVDPTGIQSNKNIKFEIYPNPSQGLVYINVDKSSDVQFLNALGDIVFEKNINKNTSNLDVSHLAKGMYFVKIQVNETILVKKLLIE